MSAKRYVHFVRMLLLLLASLAFASPLSDPVAVTSLSCNIPAAGESGTYPPGYQTMACLKMSDRHRTILGVDWAESTVRTYVDDTGTDLRMPSGKLGWPIRGKDDYYVEDATGLRADPFGSGLMNQAFVYIGTAKLPSNAASSVSIGAELTVYTADNLTTVSSALSPFRVGQSFRAGPLLLTITGIDKYFSGKWNVTIRPSKPTPPIATLTILSPSGSVVDRDRMMLKADVSPPETQTDLGDFTLTIRPDRVRIKIQYWGSVVGQRVPVDIQVPIRHGEAYSGLP